MTQTAADALGLAPSQVRFELGDTEMPETPVSGGSQTVASTGCVVFVEVHVDPDLGEVRVTRVVGVHGVGNILNTKTARSQLIGGVVFGAGMALLEETVADTRTGRVMNPDLAEYHIPVNADIPDIDITFVPETDPHVNPLGIKGISEIGIIGTVAAVANTVYHAASKRVRDLPITLDKVMA